MTRRPSRFDGQAEATAVMKSTRRSVPVLETTLIVASQSPDFTFAPSFSGRTPAACVFTSIQVSIAVRRNRYWPPTLNAGKSPFWARPYTVFSATLRKPSDLGDGEDVVLARHSYSREGNSWKKSPIISSIR